MTFEANSDQTLMRDTTRAFLESRVSIRSTRALADDVIGYEADLWRGGAELGWTSLLVPHSCGGGSVSGDGLADAAVVAYEFGRLVAPGPLVPVNVVAATISAGSGVHDHSEAIDALLSGSATATWTPVGPDAGVPLTIERGSLPGTWVVEGESWPVESALGSTWILATGVGGDGPVQLLVPTATPGVTVTPMGGLDLVRRFARVRFDHVVVSADALVGDHDTTARAVARQLAIAVVLQCSESVGAVAALFEQTLRYLGDRYSFGRPLNSYQALKHRCADDALALERCRATVDAARAAVSNAASDADELVSIAKAFVGPTSTEIVQDCIQLHGGIGVTWEHDAHLYLRRVTTNRMTYGTPEEHLDRIAVATLGSVA